MRKAGFTLTLGEILNETGSDSLSKVLAIPVTMNDVPIDGAEMIGDRLNLIQDRANVVPTSAVISMITEVLGVDDCASGSKKVEAILKNFGEEYGLI